MKRKYIFFVLVSIFLISFNSVYCYETPVLIDNDADTQLFFTNGQNIFYINGTYWVFNPHDDQNRINMYYSQDNGSSWVETNTVMSGITYTDVYYDFAYDEINNKMFLWADFFSPNSYARFRNGIFYPNGTIEWGSAWQNWNHGQSHFYPSCFVYDNIFFGLYGYSGDNKVHVVKNGNTDGTFAVASGYPKTIESINAHYSHATGYANSTTFAYFLIGDYNNKDLYINTLISDTVGTEQLLFNDLQDYWYYDAVLDDLNNLHIVRNDGSNNIIYNMYNDTGLTDDLILGDCQSTSAPLISFDDKTYDIYVSWFESAIFMKQYDYSENEWLDEIQVTDTIGTLVNNYYVNNMKKNFGYDSLSWYYLAGNGDDLYFVTYSLDPDRTLPEPPPEPESPPPYNEWFFYLGLVSIIFILMYLVITKHKIGV